MSKILYLGILTGLLLACLFVACSPLATPSATQSPEPETETPVPTASHTETSTLAPVTPTPEFAPFCEPGAASISTPVACQLPIAEQSTVFCTNKKPYNLIFMNEGSAYEVLNEGFECSDAGMNDGRQMVTCTGPMESYFALRICDPACAIPTIQAEITQCPQGYDYNNLLGCCTQVSQPIDQNCMLLKLETKNCVVNCNELIKKSACEKNSYICEWDTDNNVCQIRQ